MSLENLFEQEINTNDMYFHTYNQTENARFSQRIMTRHFLVEYLIHFLVTFVVKESRKPVLLRATPREEVTKLERIQTVRVNG